MKAALLALLGLLAAPLAAADASHEGGIPYDGSTTMPVDVTIGCDVILTSGGGSATIATQGLPAWLNATSTTVPFAATDCAANPARDVVKPAELTLTPSPGAPGLVNVSLNASVVYTGQAPGPLGEPQVSALELPEVFVAYRPGHTLTPSGDQTFTVTNGTYSFDMTLDITANARTMVMFEDKRVSAGLLTGLQAHVFNVPNGERQLVQPVRFTAPQGPWEQVNVTFYNYSHCLDGQDCKPQLEANVTWTFVNADGQAAPANGGKESKGAPGLPISLMAVGLVAAVLVLRRRNP